MITAIGEYRQADLERAGVEVELPEDPETEIQILLSLGEGQEAEFKRQPPADTVESKRTVFKTVAALANGSGGRVVFGVEKDEATICGLEGIDPLRERDRLIQLARSIVTPAPEVDIRQYELDGKTILVMSVEAGPDAPYGITPGSKDRPAEFYVRRGATTSPPDLRKFETQYSQGRKQPRRKHPGHTPDKTAASAPPGHQRFRWQ